MDNRNETQESLISASFQHGLAIAFDFAIAACLIAGVASLLRGSKYVHELDGATEEPGTEEPVTAPAARVRLPDRPVARGLSAARR